MDSKCQGSIFHLSISPFRGYGVQFSQKTCFINAATACDRRGGDGEINPPVVFEVVNP